MFSSVSPFFFLFSCVDLKSEERDFKKRGEKQKNKVSWDSGLIDMGGDVDRSK